MWRIGWAPNIIPIYERITNNMQRYTFYLYLETALHVSVGISTHHQERIQLYLLHLLFVTLLLLSAAIVEELELVWVCYGWRTPPTARVPSKHAIKAWNKNFEETGTALKKKPTGRPRRARTPQNIEAARFVSVLRSPRRSVRKLAAAVRLSRECVRRILHVDLKFHP
jgi:hypothetical protein